MILTPEVRALLKRMDADDAIDRAAQLGWNAAIDAAAKLMNPYNDEGTLGALNAGEIRTLLKDSK